MIITTTAAQRAILKVALANQKVLAVNGLSMLRRLGKSEVPALEASGTVEYLTAELLKIDVGEKDEKKWEITRTGGEQVRATLVNFVRQAMVRSEAAGQLTLTTNVNATSKAVQELLDQCNDQLSLPIQPVTDIIAIQDAKAAKKDKAAKKTVAAKAAKSATPSKKAPRGKK